MPTVQADFDKWAIWARQEADRKQHLTRSKPIPGISIWKHPAVVGETKRVRPSLLRRPSDLSERTFASEGKGRVLESRWARHCAILRDIVASGTRVPHQTADRAVTSCTDEDRNFTIAGRKTILSHIDFACAETFMTEASSDPTIAMRGGGYHSDNAIGAKMVIDATVPVVDAALRSTLAKTSGKIFAIADFGAADRSTSCATLCAACALRVLTA
jgi:hypothetical protein